MKNSALKFLLFASVILNIAFLGAAGYQYYRQSVYWASPFGYKVEKGHFLFEELSLRLDQLKTMRERAMKFRSVIDGKREEIGMKRKELIALLRQDKPDKEAIAGMVSQISGVQEQMQMMIAMHMLNMKADLDKDQQQKFLDLIETAMTEGSRMGYSPIGHN
jgi:Spy/CpxP family protein refolding chaperone